MNQAHLHLLVNHLPIVGTYISVIVLIAGFLLKNSTVKNTGLSLLVLAALFAIPAQLTGEGAEEILEATGQASHDLIEAHEDAAVWGLWFSIGAGVIALISLIASIRKHSYAKGLIILSTALAIFCSTIWIRIGNSGGEIRHSEIRSGFTPTVEEEH